MLHFSADTRYKLYVNGRRVAVGPARSSTITWYYDTLDIAPFLDSGDNEVIFIVLRYFAASRAAMPFARTSYPGLTVHGTVEAGSEIIDLRTNEDWQAHVDKGVLFPTGLIDDVFLHVSVAQHSKISGILKHYCLQVITFLQNVCAVLQYSC